MGFPIIGKSEIRNALATLGIAEGDAIYVASFMAILGNAPNLLGYVNEALIESVGRSGTLIMPAFNWDYCFGDVFDHQRTPSRVGVLSEAFRNRPGVLRSVSPPWATFCAIGQDAKQIVSMRSSSPFDSDSIAQYMFDADVKYVLIGCDFSSAVFHVHWLEEKFRVPYRSWKEFRGKIRIGGHLIDDVSTMYARNLNTEVEVLVDSTELTGAFEESGKVRVTRLGFGELRSFRTRDYVEFMRPYFEQDPLAVLVPQAKPQFE